MMQTELQRKVLIERFINEILQYNRVLKKYDCIEKLWEASGMTNKDLIDELMSDRENRADDFKESIFWDMLVLLQKRIVEDSALKRFFSDLLAKKFPKIDQYVKELEDKIINGKKILIPRAEYTKYVKEGDPEGSSYFFFRVYDSDIIVLNDGIDQKFWGMQYQNALNNLIESSELGDDEICFTDEKETEVFKSKMFERFVKKQKQALANHLQVEVDELAKVYDKELTIVEAEDGFGFQGSGFGLIPAAVIEMIWLHGGAGVWLQNIQSLNKKNKFAYKYRPDFDKLFEKYCRASVRMDYQVFMREVGIFTPMMLSRDCAFVEMEALTVSMGYLYMCDCLYQLYAQMQKQYYEDFSWEKYRNKDMKTRYEGVISDLRASLSTREHQLQNLQILYETMKVELENKNDIALINELHKKEKLLRISNEKDAEIERLKAIIESQNQLINQLQNSPTNYDEEDDNSRFDDDRDNVVYQYRYLFVGDTTALGLEDLRKRFPNSIFMNTSTMNISQVQVDAVVYLIQAMGHSMYYKCKNIASLQNVKVVYFNGRKNMNALLEAIECEMRK